MLNILSARKTPTFLDDFRKWRCIITMARMRIAAYGIATLILLALSFSAARQLDEANPVYVIDPWALGMKYAPYCLL